MHDADYPAPREGFLVTMSLTVSDVERSVTFYRDVLGGKVVQAGDPAMLRLANAWLIIGSGGGPTPDRPDVVLHPPDDPGRASCFLNLRVADIAAAHVEWSTRGAEFLTLPIAQQGEMRCCIRDPDGYLIEVGEVTQRDAATL